MALKPRITLLRSIVTVLLLAAQLGADAQQPEKTRRIGVLIPGGTWSQQGTEFRRNLRELGYTEGKNVVMEVREAAGRHDRLLDLANELVRLKVDVIVAGSTPGALAAKTATGTIPIVMVLTGDPVASGLVASLARPGGNVTGLTALNKLTPAEHVSFLWTEGFKARSVPVTVKTDRPFTAGEASQLALSGDLTNFSTEARYTNSAHISAIVRLYDSSGAVLVEKPVSAQVRSGMGVGVATANDDLEYILNEALARFVMRVVTDGDIARKISAGPR